MDDIPGLYSMATPVLKQLASSAMQNLWTLHAQYQPNTDDVLKLQQTHEQYMNEIHRRNEHFNGH